MYRGPDLRRPSGGEANTWTCADITELCGAEVRTLPCGTSGNAPAEGSYIMDRLVFSSQPR